MEMSSGTVTRVSGYFLSNFDVCLLLDTVLV